MVGTVLRSAVLVGSDIGLFQIANTCDHRSVSRSGLSGPLALCKTRWSTSHETGHCLLPGRTGKIRLMFLFTPFARLPRMTFREQGNAYKAAMFMFVPTAITENNSTPCSVSVSSL